LDDIFLTMKAVILAGGRGTRLTEETVIKPKPLVEAAGHPLIWHIMQNYASHGITDFIVLVGYKGQLIREYFSNYWLHQSDVTFDLSKPDVQIHQVRSLPWKVSVVDTGLDTNTGGRLERIKDLLNDEFLLTYGDGVSDVDITKSIEAHRKSKNIISLTAVQPPARFGALELNDTQVIRFQEKPVGDGAWVNGGFFVANPEIFKYVSGSSCSFEEDVLPQIAQNGRLGFYKHTGYWQPVDTIRDLQRLEEAIRKGFLPWVENRLS
jgi:glucose-1-phosphate cytidylyltransferase